MPNTKWAAIIVLSELVDGRFEVRLENPAGGPYIACEEFSETDNPQPWINRELGKYLRAFRKDYHRPRPGLMLHSEPSSFVGPLDAYAYDDWDDDHL